MRQLTPLSRRRFGQGLSASLALTAVSGPLKAHDGAHVVEIRISRFAFVPNNVEIDPGDSVRWINEDLAPHTATARDGSWETTSLAKGEEARMTFGTPGDFAYVCAFHPHMTGTISVRSKPAR